MTIRNMFLQILKDFAPIAAEKSPSYKDFGRTDKNRITALVMLMNRDS